MIAADFLRDPTGIRIGHALPNGPTAGSCGPFLFGCNRAQAARHLHGSTKLAGEGRLWMMRCSPLISITAQSVWRGTPMDDVLHAVDLDHRPVAPHGGDLAAGECATGRSSDPAGALDDIRTGPAY